MERRNSYTTLTDVAAADALARARSVCGAARRPVPGPELAPCFAEASRSAAVRGWGPAHLPRPLSESVNVNRLLSP